MRIAAILAAVALAAVAWWASEGLRAGTSAGVRLSALRPPDAHALAVLPEDERALVFGSHAGLALSRDAGASWSLVRGAEADAMSIALAPGGRTAIIAGHDVYLRSDDGGTTWRSVRSGLPGSDVHGFAASPRGTGTFYAFVVGAGLLRTDDAGGTWARLPGAPATTYSLAVASSAGGDVIFAVSADGLRRSADGGRTWQPVAAVRAQSVAAAGALVYAAAASDLFVSSDAGASWRRLEFRPGRAALVAPAPSRPTTVYVVTGGFEVYRSGDGGATWERTGQ